MVRPLQDGTSSSQKDTSTTTRIETLGVIVSFLPVCVSERHIYHNKD